MKELFMVYFLFFTQAILFSLSPGDKYSSSSDWKGQDGTGKTIVSGQVNTTVTITAVSSKLVKIHVFKEMTPFGQVLDFDTIAILKNERYEFSEIDNWNNSVFGYIKGSGDSIDFFLDCTEFSDDGENLGRLYGDMYELTKKRG